jgi:hypothetical protein
MLWMGTRARQGEGEGEGEGEEEEEEEGGLPLREGNRGHPNRRRNNSYSPKRSRSPNLGRALALVNPKWAPQKQADLLEVVREANLREADLREADLRVPEVLPVAKEK